MGSMTFLLDQLNPKMRAQAEKKLAEMSAFGTIRTHSVDRTDPGEKRGPKAGRPIEFVSKSVRGPDLAPRRKRGELVGTKREKQRVQRGSSLERAFSYQLTIHKIVDVEREFAFLPHRKFRLDFAWPDRKIGVEVQGMVHRIKERFEGDIEKRALAQLAGWRVLEVSGKSIRRGQAIEWLKELLKQGVL